MSGTGTRRRGQALVEFGLVMTILPLLILNLVNFGMVIYSMITVANAARTGVQYMVLAGASVGGPQPPSFDAVEVAVRQDASALVQKNLVVLVCTRNNLTPPTGGCPTMPSDPEPAHYVVAVVDVTYTYVPLTGAWSFSHPIHRRAVMRMLQ